MRRIEQKVGETYLNALMCVEFRVPKKGGMSSPAYLLSLALRYGLIGAVATHHLLFEARNEEEVQEILDSAATWPDMVEEHVVQFVGPKLPVLLSPSMPYMIGRLSYRPISSVVAHFDFFTPLSHTLHQISGRFAKDYRRAMFVKCPFWRRRRTLAEFQALSEMSTFFALNFFERRRADLEEVPQIALLGE